LRAPRRSVFLAAQWIAAALVLYYIGRTLLAQWNQYRSQPLETDVHWLPIVGSAALVLATYALLIQTWRLLMGAAGAPLNFANAARIWCVSNLGRYMPGKIWQITTMGVMTQRAGVSAATAASSALLSTLINIACGVAITLALSWRWLERIDTSARAIAIVLIIGALVGLAALPVVLPALARMVSRVIGREVALDTPSRARVAGAVGGNLLAWVLYGFAFQWFVAGVLGGAAGAAWQYLAVFTASYVVGYLFLFLPGGIGPREGVMVALLTALQLTTYKQAWVVAGASRVWLTVLEIVPGILFVASDAARRRSSNTPSTDGTTH